METILRRTLGLVAGVGFACGTLALANAQDSQIPSPPGSDANYSLLTLEQVHQAFATPASHNPVEQPVIQQKPPQPIKELLPEHKPSGNNVIWIPGYWAFDQNEKDFIWISGLWRNVPPGRQWVPGYWHEVDGGFRWVPGSWVRASANVSFYPKPPNSLERGPSSRRPSANHFYVPGCWVYRNNDFQWRPGYWAPYQRDWVWVPARYTPAANGYVFSEGYWDYRLDRRGQLFAPVRFRNDAYARSDFRFGPTAVIDSNARLLLHLFVRPQRGDYVFGDYYDGGATPWFEYHGRGNGYDPLLVHYQGRETDFLNRVQGWHKYFAGHPEYRPRHTLADQLAFAKQHQQFQYLQQSSLGNTIDQLIADNGNTNDFVEVGADQIERLTGIADQVRQVRQQRLQLESEVAASASGAANASLLPTDNLPLPELSGIRVPEVGREVPDNPLNLKDIGPQPAVPPVKYLPTDDLPTGDLPTGDLPTGDLPTGDLPLGVPSPF